MTSATKIAANRRNSQRSCGPRTVAGKLTVSRNALRHGLAATTLRHAGIAAEVDRLATAIGGEHADAAQREQALIIAESEITLLRVRAVRTSIFEQMLLAMGAAGPQEPSEQLRGRQPAGVIGRSHFEQLRRLERYERRAFSTRQRAIRILLDVQHLDRAGPAGGKRGGICELDAARAEQVRNNPLKTGQTIAGDGPL